MSAASGPLPSEPELSAGQLIRQGAAVARKVAPPVASQILRELQPLEAGEYLKKSTGLTIEQRTRLWALRASLRGVDAQGTRSALADLASAGGTLRGYWAWVIDNAYPAAEAGSAAATNQIPGNLASAIALAPERREYVLRSWVAFAQLLEIDYHPTIEQLAAVLDRCTLADVQAPTPRALDLGLRIATLSGLPPALVTAHADAWLAEHAILMATNEVHHERARRASFAEFRACNRTQVSLSYAPHTVVLPDGRMSLVLAAPEFELLNEDLAGQVLRRLLRGLRSGELPGNGLAFAAALSAFRTRRGRGASRDAAPLEDPDRLRAIDGRDGLSGAPGYDCEPELLDTVTQFMVAQDWLSTAIELKTRQLASKLAQQGPQEIFPTKVYGQKGSAGLDLIYLRAAENCLQYVVSGAHLDRVSRLPRLPVEDQPRAEFARHMRSTAPGRWHGSPAARQAVGGYLAAVACAAWSVINQVQPADAPSIALDRAQELLIAARSFAGLAALDGLLSMLRRFAPPAGRQTAGWLNTVTAGAEAIWELSTAVSQLPGIASHPARPGVRGAMIEVGNHYAEQAASDIAVAAAARILDAADRLGGEQA